MFIIIRRTLLLCLVLLLQPTSVFAVLTDNLTIGNAKAVSLAHAVTADPPGIDSIHFNPAGIARLNGSKSHYKLITADFAVELEIGDYEEGWQNLMDDRRATGRYDEAFFYDEARLTTSKTEGASLMLPGMGMTDLDVLLGPAGGWSHQSEGSRFTIASSVYTPLSVGFYRDKNDPGRFIGERLSLFRLTYFSPTIAYEVNDSLALGASVNFSYAGVGLELAFRGPHIGLYGLKEAQDMVCEEQVDLPVDLCGGGINLYDELGYLSIEVEDPVTIGYNLGLLWDLTEWLTFGMVYQSAVDMEMKGEFKWTSTDVWVDFLEPIVSSPNYALFEEIMALRNWTLPEGKPNVSGASALTMEMPEHYAFGLSLKVTPRLKVNLDYKFTAWSAWPELPLDFSIPVDVLRLAAIIQPDVASPNAVAFPFGLKDSWNYAVGIEYRYSDKLLFRGGFEPRDSSIPPESVTPLLPVGDGTFYGLGFGYRPGDGSEIDVGLGYLETEVIMAGGDSPLGNSLDPTLLIYNPYKGSDITATLSTVLLEFSYLKNF